MNYEVEVQTVTEYEKERFSVKCGELETELQSEDVYNYYTEYFVTPTGQTLFPVLYTAIFRIYYEKEPVNIYGGTVR